MRAWTCGACLLWLFSELSLHKIPSEVQAKLVHQKKCNKKHLSQIKNTTRGRPGRALCCLVGRTRRARGGWGVSQRWNVVCVGVEWCVWLGWVAERLHYCSALCPHLYPQHCWAGTHLYTLSQHSLKPMIQNAAKITAHTRPLPPPSFSSQSTATLREEGFEKKGNAIEQWIGSTAYRVRRLIV